MFIFEILNGYIDCKNLLEQIGLNPNHLSLRHRELFKIPFNATNYGMNNPIERAIRASKAIEVDSYSISSLQLKNYFETILR